MKHFFILSLVLSFLIANNYSQGFKFYMQAKRYLYQNNQTKANILFLKAKNNFIIAAKKDSSQAILKLATLYCHGWGVKQNNKTANLYLNKAKKLIPNIHIYDECLINLKN